jgi:predicted phage terminase large subunit-like protein
MSIEKLAVAKVKCLQNTLFFTRYFFKELNGRKFVIGRHHRIIAEALDRVFTGKTKNLIINVPPRYGKTEIAVKMAIAKGLALNPKAKFIHLSYSDTLALDNSETVKEIVKMPQYQTMFPEVKIKRGTDSKQKWYTTEGGGVYAAAAGGQITGFGAGIVDEEEPEISENQETDEDVFDDWFNLSEGFGGAIIIDDPIKPEDANYERKRTAVNDRFDSTIVNRINSRNTPIIIIMQRVHSNDLSGHVIENYEDYEVISLPALYKDDEGKTQALWPHKHSVKELLKQRKANEFVFYTQMMQDPTPKHGLLFPKSELKYFRPDPSIQYDSAISYADIADEGEDFFSMPVGKNKGPDIYITDVFWSDEGTEITIPLASKMINENRCQYTIIEGNAMGAIVKNNIMKLTPNTSIYGINNNANKLTRIKLMAGFIIRHCRFVHPNYQSEMYRAWFKNLTDFTKNGQVKHDDAADSLSGLCKAIESLMNHYYQ